MPHTYFGLVVEAAKAKGLTIAEQELKLLTETMIDVGSSELAKNPNAILKTFGTLLPVVKAPLLGLEDKLDGVEGN